MRLKITGKAGSKDKDQVLLADKCNFQIIDMDTNEPIKGITEFKLFATVGDVVKVQLTLMPTELELDVEKVLE